jgi:xylulose-5-phosphate/fructose-6-phosphate phosphoketolase
VSTPMGRTAVPNARIDDLIVACVVGGGEAETGYLATALQSNKFLNPIADGAALPISHLSGYKIGRQP